MQRAILEACLPWLGLLAAAGLVLVLLTRLAGARFQLGRLAEVHRNEEGAAQTFAFAATLPFFIFLMVFVLQLVQLMIGTVVVHYAAFAAARAAIVWIPARVDAPYQDSSGNVVQEQENCISARVLESGIPSLDAPGPGGVTHQIEINPNSLKVRKIFTAAVLACMPISPSAALPSNPSQVAIVPGRLIETYLGMAQNLSGNPKSTERLTNKLNYAAGHTRLQMSCYHPNDEPDVALRADYDPVAQVVPASFTYGEQGQSAPTSYIHYWRPFREFRSNEVGWQDAITVTVSHDMALFGPIWPLAGMISMIPGSATHVYGPVARVGEVTVCTLTAQATLGLEGEKSSIPYVCEQQP